MTSAVLNQQGDLEQWSTLRAWILQDPARMAQLQAYIEDSSSQSESFARWLLDQANKAPATVSNVINGGNVEKIINIAKAEHVFVSPSLQQVFPYQLYRARPGPSRLPGGAGSIAT